MLPVLLLSLLRRPNKSFQHSTLQNKSLQVPCSYKNDFVSSIILTNVRNVLNDSFGSRTELVQKAYDTISTLSTVQHR